MHLKVVLLDPCDPGKLPLSLFPYLVYDLHGWVLTVNAKCSRSSPVQLYSAFPRAITFMGNCGPFPFSISLTVTTAG